MKGLVTGIIVALVAGALLAAAFLTGLFPGRETAEEGDGDRTEETAEPEGEDASGVPAPGFEGVPEMIEGPLTVDRFVEGEDYEFEPDSITVPRGTRVRLTFKNEGNLIHTYTIDELGLDTGSVSPGSSKTVEFDSPESATVLTYRSYCAVPGHVELGMVGTLVVE